MRRPIAHGSPKPGVAHGGCRPKRSGSLPPAEGWRLRLPPGDARFPRGRYPPEPSSGRGRSVAARLTATASATWERSSTSGAPTGTSGRPCRAAARAAAAHGVTRSDGLPPPPAAAFLLRIDTPTTDSAFSARLRLRPHRDRLPCRDCRLPWCGGTPGPGPAGRWSRESRSTFESSAERCRRRKRASEPKYPRTVGPGRPCSRARSRSASRASAPIRGSDGNVL